MLLPFNVNIISYHMGKVTNPFYLEAHILRIIQAEQIAQAVCGMCVHTNTRLPEDVAEQIVFAGAPNPGLWRAAYWTLWAENWKLAEKTGLPICQDAGMVCLFLESGDQMHIDGTLVWG